MNKALRVLGHVAMLSGVALIATYWGIKVLTPPPASAPPPLAAPPPRDPDPVLVARMLGLVQSARTVVVSNIQVTGVFAAGRDSSAVLVVDGKPARVFLLGQEVAPGTSLEAVRPDGVTLSGAAGKQDVRIPPRPVASFGGPAPAPAFSLSGNTLSSPSETPNFAGRPAPVVPNPAREPPPPQVASPPRSAPPPGVQPDQPPPPPQMPHPGPGPTSTN